MNKIECRIEVLSHAKSQVGNYILVLSEINGDRKLPIILKSSDAQFIIVKMDNIYTPRPSIHDLFKSLGDVYNIDIQEVMIYKILDGVFYAKITSSNMVDSIDIECTVGDALTLATLYKCPIYVANEVMENASMSVNNKVITKKNPPLIKTIETIETLSKLLEEAIQMENYELAVEIRDKIENFKKV